MEDKKRFYITAGSVVGLWLFGSVLILVPAAGKIREEREAVQNLLEQIEQLESPVPPSDRQIEEIRIRNRAIAADFEELSRALAYRPETDAREDRVALYQFHRTQRLQSLLKHAERQGIALAEEGELFPQVADQTFHAGYWAALDTGTRLLTLLLELGAESPRLRSIGQVRYPDIRNPSDHADSLVFEFPLEVTLDSEWGFLPKIVWHCSQPEPAGKTPLHFLEVQKIDVQRDPNLPDGDVRARITLVALYLNPEGKVRQESEARPSEAGVKWGKEWRPPTWDRH